MVVKGSEMSLRKFRDALIVMGVFLAVIWILQVANWADGYRLDTEFGILPEHVSRLGDIFTAPFLHFSWQHIEGNSVPLFVLGVLAAWILRGAAPTRRARRPVPAAGPGGKSVDDMLRELKKQQGA